jgi:hypothetical protein
MPIYHVKRARCTETETIEAICPRSAVIEFMHSGVQEGCMPPEEVVVTWIGGEEIYVFKKKEPECPSKQLPQSRQSLLRKLFRRLFRLGA